MYAFLRHSMHIYGKIISTLKKKKEKSHFPVIWIVCIWEHIDENKYGNGMESGTCITSKYKVKYI